MPLVVRLAGTNVEEGRENHGRERACPSSRRYAGRRRREGRGSLQRDAGLEQSTASSARESKMSILIDETTRVIVQGFTGDKGTFHAKEMIDLRHQRGRRRDARAKGGTTHLGLPVFNTVKDAVRATGATASLVFVPPPFCADAIMEAADAGLGSSARSPTASRRRT